VIGVPQDEDTGSARILSYTATLQAPSGIEFHGARKLHTLVYW